MVPSIRALHHLAAVGFGVHRLKPQQREMIAQGFGRQTIAEKPLESRIRFILSMKTARKPRGQPPQHSNIQNRIRVEE